MVHFDLSNKGQPGVPYYTPAQEPAAGTAADASKAPSLFKPLRMRSVELHNRFVVSPMCQYSAPDGHLTDYHLVHLGQFALKGAGLIMVEATAVEARGRISPQDAGLWKESHVEPMRRVVDFAHSQNTKAAAQIAHAGRKASTLAPWIGGSASKALAGADHWGWPDDVVGPSEVAFADDYAKPKELTVDEIAGLVNSFVETALRAVEAGFDIVEVHAAHGYLLNQFLSPISNTRTDQYGGSFDNRIRFLREVVQAVRAAIPASMPLWVRISATEWMEYTGHPSWDLESSIRLAKLLPGWGVDALDVSSGANNAAQRIPIHKKTYQTDLAKAIHRAVRADKLDLLVGAVGMIDDATFARDLVDEGGAEQAADFVLVARQFLRDPHFVLSAAEELAVPVKWPNQYHKVESKAAHDAFKEW